VIVGRVGGLWSTESLVDFCLNSLICYLEPSAYRGFI